MSANKVEAATPNKTRGKGIAHILDCLRILSCWNRTRHRQEPPEPPVVYDAASTTSDDAEEKDDTGRLAHKKSELSPSSYFCTTRPDYKVPRTQRALVVAGRGEYQLRNDFPVPQEIGDSEVMIRTYAVGLNPIDWKSVDYNFCLPEFPWVTGRELSGIVVKTGSAVKTVQTGQRVWTSTYYRDIRAGCFQDYVVVPAHTVLALPENLTFEESACLGVAALTACMALWRWLQVPMPSADDLWDNTDQWLLIWGGSTVTGQFATQLARRSGLRVITVTSESTRRLSEQLGASHVVVRDGKTDDEIVRDIRRISHDGIVRAIDVVGPKTTRRVLQAVSANAPVHFAPLAMMAKDQVVPDNVVVHTVEMKQFMLDPSSARYADELNMLVRSGRVKLPEIIIKDGGFDDIVAGLSLLKKGSMGGKKIVVKIPQA